MMSYQMNRELEQLKKKSIHYVELSSDLKDQVIQSHLNELNKVVKNEVKKHYGANVLSINPFVSLNLENHIYQ